MPASGSGAHPWPIQLWGGMHLLIVLNVATGKSGPVSGEVSLRGDVGRQALNDITIHYFSLCHWDFPVERISLTLTEGKFLPFTCYFPFLWDRLS